MKKKFKPILLSIHFCLLFILISQLPSTVHAQPYLQENLIDDRTERATAEGLQWLADQQNENGSFGSAKEYSQDVGVTSLCGLAFLCSGSVPEAGPYSKQVVRCADFVLSCSNPNGYLNDAKVKTHGPMYGHGFGTMFLAEIYGMTHRKDVRDALKRAVNLIIATQNPQGGWRYEPVPDEADISVTVCQVMALRAARNAGIAVPKEVIDRAVDYIKKCQNPDGGFRYRLFDPAESKVARSAAALVALYSAGITEGPVIKRGFEYLNPEIIEKAESEYFFYSQYYLVQAYWHRGDRATWYAAFSRYRNKLLTMVEDKHWKDSVTGDEYATAMALIVLQLPKDLVPIFER